MKKILLGILATTLLSVNPIAYGANELININFGVNYTGVAATGQAGDQWNNLPAGSLDDYHDGYGGTGSIALKNSLGGASGATLTTWQFDGFTSITYNTENAFYNHVGSGLMKGYDYVNVAADPGLLTVSGLAPGAYNIYVYSQSEKDTTTPPMAITINGTIYTKPLSGMNTHSTFINGTNYYVYPVTISSGQNLSMIFVNSSTENAKAAINGLQIAAVPEPSSVALLGVGGIFILGLFKMRAKGLSDASV